MPKILLVNSSQEATGLKFINRAKKTRPVIGYKTGERYISSGNPIVIILETSLNKSPSGVITNPIDRPINETTNKDKNAKNVCMPGL